MNVFLIGSLVFSCGLVGLTVTLCLAYFFSAHVVRTAMTAGATATASSIAANVPEKKKVFSYLFKQVFYWKSWTARFSAARQFASATTSSIKEIGFWRTTWKGCKHLAVASWNALKSFTKALILPYAIAFGVSCSAMALGSFLMVIGTGIWAFS